MRTSRLLLINQGRNLPSSCKTSLSSVTISTSDLKVHDLTVFRKPTYIGYSRLLIQALLDIEAGGCSGKRNIARQYWTARSMWLLP